jgi:hypothetical protein
MEVGPPRLLRNGLGSLTILAVLATIAVGLPAIDRGLPASRPVAVGIPYPVGAGVTVVPPPDSVVDLAQTRPGASRGTALFLAGAIRYLVVVTPYSGSLEGAGYRLRNKIISTRGYQVTARDNLVMTASGLSGRQGGYTAPGRSGLYAVFVVDGLSIEVTVSGTDPQLRDALNGIEASTRSIAYQRMR